MTEYGLWLRPRWSDRHREPTRPRPGPNRRAAPNRKSKIENHLCHPKCNDRRQAALGLTATAQDRSPTGALLLDIFLLFIDYKTDRLFSRDIVAALNMNPERPWAELRKSKTLTENWLSNQLRPYDIRSRSIRIDEHVARGYLLDDLKAACKRYIPKSELDALKTELAERTMASSEISNPKSEITGSRVALRWTL